MRFSLSILGSTLSPATVLFGDCDGSNTNPHNTYTFKNQNIDTPANDRTLIALTFSANANLQTNKHVTWVRINGNNMRKSLLKTVAAQAFGVWTYPLPTGKTCTFAIKRSGRGFTRAYFVLFQAYGLKSVSHINYKESFGNSPLTMSIDLEAGGILCGLAYDFNTKAMTWSGATEVCDERVDVRNTARLSGGLLSKRSAEASHAVTTTAGSSHSQYLVTFR